MGFTQRIIRYLTVGIAAAILGNAVALPVGARQTPRKPNVVMILVDSMGYGDIDPYGAPDVRTPSLNRLAREGVRLTDGYSNGPVCTPTRAAFLTGRYQQRVGLEWALQKDRKDAGLPSSEISLARLLKQNGYATGVFGKWHLGYKPEFGPNAHGFDEFFGILDWSVDYYTHKNIDGEPDLHENTKAVERPGYMTDLITERAVTFIDRHAGEPFFAYVAYNAMVSPIQPPDKPNDIRTRETWNQATREDYVRMVERVDEGVGKILKTLDRDGLARDTLVVFTNDHGGQWYSRREPLFHGFGTVWEGAIRVPYLFRWPGHLPAGRVSHQPIITMDLTASILSATGTASAKGRDLDGIDVLPLLSGKQAPVERTFFWRIGRPGRQQKAVRKGKWKYVWDLNSELLFDLDSDMAERHDLAYQHRDVVLELRKLMTEWEAELARTPPPFVVK
jgi:arylsulfatase A-like enzyme